MIATWGRKLRDSGLSLAILLLLPLGVYLAPWLNGDVAQDGTALLNLPPWEVHLSAEGEVPSRLSGWQLRTSWPAYQFISSNRHNLSELQWNPATALGLPFLANPENRVFSPFTCFFYLFSFEFALLLSLVSKAVAAGWVAFYVARRYGFTAWYALIVALIFQWSGAVFIWGMEPLSDSLVWLPLLVLATDRLILGQFRAWPGVALVAALMIISGGLYLLVVSLVVMVLYMFFRRLRDHKRAHIVAALPGFLLAIAAALGLAAVQIAPYVELLRQGNTIDQTYPWSFDGNLLLGIFGPSYYQNLTGLNNPLVHVVFIGVVPLLFVGLWGALRRLIDRPIRHRVESLLFASLLVVAVPVLTRELLPTLHGFRLLSPVHYLVGLSFPLGLMVAGVVECWLHLNADQCKRALLRMGLILPVFWGALLVFFILFSRNGSGEVTIHWPTFWVFTGSVAFLAILFGGTLLYPKARILIVGTIGLILVTTAWGTLGWLPHAARADIFPQTEVIRSLQQADARVGGTAQMREWPLTGNEIPTLYGPSTVTLNRTERFLRQLAKDPLLQRRAAISMVLLRKEDIRGIYAPVRADLNIVDVFDSGLILFRDQGAYPRIRIAHEVESNALEATRLVRDALPVVPDLLLPPLPGPVDDSIKITDVPRNDALDVEVEMGHPGVLIVAEAWYPGWRAWVDGTPVPILPVDGALRGVELSTGKHEVSFRYQSGTFRWGAVTTLVFALLFLIGAYFSARQRPARQF